MKDVSKEIKNVSSKLNDGFMRLEKKLDDGFTSMNEKLDDGFMRLEKKLDDGFTSLNKKLDDGFTRLEKRMGNLEKIMIDNNSILTTISRQLGEERRRMRRF